MPGDDTPPVPLAVRRRRLLQTAPVLPLGPLPGLLAAGRARAASPPATLLSAPLELGGDWGGSLPGSAQRVIARMRAACLAGIGLVSDRQPERLRVDDHSSGPPAVWLHDNPPRTAWVIVDIGARDWSKLAYQFGHELGHVLCNSWWRDARPSLPCQWLEESLVEAFSIRGLGLLAESWERDPPFAGDAAFGQAIRDYRGNLLRHYAADGTGIGTWFRANRSALEHMGGVNVGEGPAIVAVAAALEAEPAQVADLGTLNRWPGRTGVPLEAYFDRWAASCRDLGAPGSLPAWLRATLGLG
jgi:hypothetical protein